MANWDHAGAWLVAAAAFVAFVASHTIAKEVTGVEVGYCGATALLALMLALTTSRMKGSARLAVTRCATSCA